MTINYTSYVAQLSNLMVISSTNADFQIFLPGCIDYAEQRVYRELDLLATRVTDTSASFTIESRTFTLPTTQGTYVVLEEINAISPAGTLASAGTRNPLTAVSKPWLDAVYPSNSATTGVPQYFAMISQTQVAVGPAPDAAYVAEVIGTQRPTPLSASNSSTFLTQNLPDLFMAASMVFATAYQRDFGAQTDDPRASASWEAQYKQLFASANVEENRKKFFAEGWTSQNPSPVATPARV